MIFLARSIKTVKNNFLVAGLKGVRKKIQNAKITTYWVDRPKFLKVSYL
jgi:hypothetical protein